MIQKWNTWVIPTKDLEKFTDAELLKLRTILEDEIRLTLRDIKNEMPTTFKITNLSRRDEQETT